MSQPLTDDPLLDTLLVWLNARMAPPGVIIEAETPLFEGGLINSIRILELIAWTEVATGSRIPDRMIRMDNFASPGRIAAVFRPEANDVVD